MPWKIQRLLQRNLRECLCRNAEILGQHRGRRVSKPIRYQQCVEFVGVAVVEANDEFTAVRAESLQRMRSAGGKIPEVALVDVRNIRPAFGVENRHAATAVRHDRPLGSLMPVQFPDAARGQPHVDARYLLRNREVFHRDLTRPAAVLNALGRVVERRPVHRHAADIGCRRKLRRGKLVAEGLALRAGVAEISWSLGVDRALRRLVRIAEGGGAHRVCGHHGACSGDCQHISSRKHVTSPIQSGALASRCVQFRMLLAFKSDADVRVGTWISTTP